MIIAIDLETTGLDPKTDHILEIGMLAICQQTLKEVGSFKALVKPEVAGSISGMSDYVKDMHYESGLLREVLEDGVPLAEAVKGAIAFYDEFAWGVRSPMMGANPGFDRGFLLHHAPKLADRFHYRNFDTNSFWLLREFLLGREGAGPKPGVAHRAVDDCRQCLKTIQNHFLWMRDLFGQEAEVLRKQIGELQR